MRKLLFLIIANLFSFILLKGIQCDGTIASIHTWELYEVTLSAENKYDNYYRDVTCWVDLEGPDFSKRIYGFWDGDNIFRVRIVATRPGNWQWVSGSDKEDKGLNHQEGEFTAIEWTEKEKIQNPNRHGFIRSTPNGHALQYADDTPFFLLGDTWLAASTWRLPFRNSEPQDDYEPGPGIGFEEAVMYRKNQGFNSVSFIASFPNWESDEYGHTYNDENGVYLRNAWEKFDYPVKGDQLTAKAMRDEYGNKPFRMSEVHKGVADFDKITPEFFQSLDKKMQYLSDAGFVPLMETIRRDNCPPWKAYFNFNESYARYVQYLISRYGAYNLIFSGIHLDWIPKLYSLTADEFNEALTFHLKKYGPLPFGQPHSTLINNSTFTQFGHGDSCPWLTMHSVGNNPRDHRMTDTIEILFRLQPAYPAVNFEPYYTGWIHDLNKPNGERPEPNSERDNYFSRAMMYNSVLSGGLSGHVHGTAAYDMTTTGEPDILRPHFWDALKFESAVYMKYLRSFIMSEGKRYQELQPVSDEIKPQKAPGSVDNALDGWSYMMRTPEKNFALLYFENKAVLPQLAGFIPGSSYSLEWFDTMTGEWKENVSVSADRTGKILIPSFPDSQKSAERDWALKIIQVTNYQILNP